MRPQVFYNNLAWCNILVVFKVYMNETGISEAGWKEGSL